jgi:hypothetical protein
MSNYLQILETIFVKPNFTINVLDLADTYTDIEEQLIINIFQINSNSNNNSCVKFIIYYENERKTQTNLYIDNLYKCNISGSQVLNMLENFCRQSEITKIVLSDTSNIIFCNKIKISLAYIYLLATGQSWYNKLGYINEFYIENYNFNLLQISRIVKDVIPILLTKLSDKTNKDTQNFILLNELKQYFNQTTINIDELTRLCILTLNNIINTNSENLTIQALFIKIQSFLKENIDVCNNIEITNFIKFVSLLIRIIISCSKNCLDFCIKYSSGNLTKEIIKTGGKRSRRSNRRSKKKSKKKRSRRK